MTTHTHSPNRKFTRLMAITLAAFAQLLTVAPGAQAKEGPTTDVISTAGCPDGWVLGPRGCQPGDLTTETDKGACHGLFVGSHLPGGCEAGYFTANPGTGVSKSTHYCFFSDLVCAPMIEAAEALEGHCEGARCEVP